MQVNLSLRMKETFYLNCKHNPIYRIARVRLGPKSQDSGYQCHFGCGLSKKGPKNNITSVSKKLGQSAIVYYYCALSQFF